MQHVVSKVLVIWVAFCTQLKFVPAKPLELTLDEEYSDHYDQVKAKFSEII